MTDSPVVRANRALAVGFRDGFVAGLAALDEVADDPRLARTNAVAPIRADLLQQARRFDEARRWYRIALEGEGSGSGAGPGLPATPARRLCATS